MSDEQNIYGYKGILEDLHGRYYERFSNHSTVTSSFWREVGRHKISKKNDEYITDGFGFGSYPPNNLINQIKSFPKRILLSYLLGKHRCPKYLIKAGKETVAKSGFIFNFDSAKQILSLGSILRALNSGDNLTGQGIRSVCVIGDGYAFFSNLIKCVDPDIRVISVNLGRTLFFDVLFSQRCHPQTRPMLLKAEENRGVQLSNSQLTFIEAEKFNLLENSDADLFINIASMQEMDPAVVKSYFRLMRSTQKSPCYFYCCNRLKKELPDGTITEFMKYPWEAGDRVLIDQLCPWYQKYPLSKPPFWHPLDGPTQHRLARIK